MLGGPHTKTHVRRPHSRLISRSMNGICGRPYSVLQPSRFFTAAGRKAKRIRFFWNSVGVEGKPKSKPMPKPRNKAEAEQQAQDAQAQAAADAAAAAAQPDESANIIYQASISDVTRDCSRADGQLTMKIAVAGKIVPGPKFTPGTITMPIRTAVMHGTDVLYSQIHQYQVQVTDPSVATQFVFTDSNVVVPAPTAQDYQAYAGYDETTPKATTDKPKKTHRKKAAATN